MLYLFIPSEMYDDEERRFYILPARPFVILSMVCICSVLGTTLYAEEFDQNYGAVWSKHHASFLKQGKSVCDLG